MVEAAATAESNPEEPRTQSGEEIAQAEDEKKSDGEEFEFEQITHEEAELAISEMPSIEEEEKKHVEMTPEEQKKFKQDLAKRLAQRTSSELDGEERESDELIDGHNAELMAYISEMLLMISTGDETVDMANMELVAGNIHTKSVMLHQQYLQQLKANQDSLKKQMKKATEEELPFLVEQQVHIGQLQQDAKQPPSKEKVVQYLTKMREEFLEQVALGLSPQEVSETMGKRVFKGGLMTMQTTSMALKSTSMAAVTAASAGTSATVGAAGAVAAPGPIGLIVTGALFTAQTGLDYRKYKKGEITKDEFKSRTKKGVFATTGSMVGTTGGMVGGFFAGQLLIPVPVVGGLIGTVVGGFAGGMTGAKVSIKLYDKMEQKMAEHYEESLKRQAEEEEKQAQEQDQDGDPDELEESEVLTYEGALELLGAREEQSFSSISKQFRAMIKSLVAVQQKESEDGVDADLQQTVKIIKRLNKALDTVQDYRIQHGSHYERIEVENQLRKKQESKEAKEKAKAASQQEEQAVIENEASELESEAKAQQEEGKQVQEEIKAEEVEKSTTTPEEQKNSDVPQQRQSRAPRLRAFMNSVGSAFQKAPEAEATAKQNQETSELSDPKTQVSEPPASEEIKSETAQTTSIQAPEESKVAEAQPQPKQNVFSGFMSRFSKKVPPPSAANQTEAAPRETSAAEQESAPAENAEDQGASQ